MHLDFLRALLEKRPSQNVVYQWEWNADGFKSQDQLIRDGCPAPKRMGTGKSAVKQKSWHQSRVLRNRILPRLVIAKRYGYDQCGILVPNCYFESVDEWERVRASIREVPRRRRRRAVEAPLQVRGGVFPDEAPVASREGSQAVTDARRSTSTPRAASDLRAVSSRYYSGSSHPTSTQFRPAPDAYPAGASDGCIWPDSTSASPP